ncbi:MAG: hypothetical protein GXX96_28435 [Planctomycetaceae bacterium]|nr:hypothetical protein [Planctomycetaceae bacterium]
MIGLHAAILALALTGAEPDEPVLLDFSIAGCLPCRQMDPVIDGLIAKGYSIRKISANQQPDLARKFGVSQFPCFVMTVGGRETSRVLGAVAPEHLEKMFADAQKLTRPKLLPEPEALPLQNAANVGARPIPLPHKQATSALAMEVIPDPFRGGVIGASNSRSPAASPPIALASLNRGATDGELIAATVRLRVHDRQGPSLGTGTIIDTREGRALILTCGHIFRDYQEGGRIEVGLFGPTEGHTVDGRLLSFDDDRDVGLLTIQVPAPVKTARVAPRDYAVETGETVVNVGCNHGEDPSVRRNRVTARNRYAGPANIEVAGLPVQGRSGGGLFSAEGYVIGVCNAADPECNEGLYAALPSIHEQLDEANLSFVYGEEATPPVTQASFVSNAGTAMPKTMPQADPVQHLTQSRDNVPVPPQHKEVAGSLTADEQRLLGELSRRRAEGAEIVCIIRTKGTGDAPSEVFLFENASPALVQRLDAEGFTRR